MTKVNDKQLIDLGRAVLQTEADSVSDLLNRVDDSFAKACRLILECHGRTICIGMGKSGHIGNKIAATLASTGTPAFFVHPGEASHGDLGMITDNDVVVALSNSGETDELLTLLPVIKRLNISLIAITGNPDSTLAETADSVLNVSVKEEACPLGLAPTSSTTAALAMGDALAIALLTTRGFKEDDFALAHPGGTLGRKLLIHVSDLMHKDNAIPTVLPNTSAHDLLIEMTEKGLGAALITDETKKKPLGIFTDGDLRRTLDSDINFKDSIASDIMTRNFTSIKQSILAAEALQIMEQRKINALPVTDDNDQLVGIINMHDLLKAKVV